MAADHGSLDRPARSLAGIGGWNTEDESADVGKQAAVVSKEGAEDLGYGPDELTVGEGEKEVPAEVLPQKEGPLFGGIPAAADGSPAGRLERRVSRQSNPQMKECKGTLCRFEGTRQGSAPALRRGPPATILAPWRSRLNGPGVSTPGAGRSAPTATGLWAGAEFSKVQLVQEMYLGRRVTSGG